MRVGVVSTLKLGNLFYVNVYDFIKVVSYQ